MKIKIGENLALLVIFTSLALSGCFSPWKGDATLTLLLGTGSVPASREVSGPDAKILSLLTHTVYLKLKGTTSPHIINIEEGVKTLSLTVDPGYWEITVKAFLGDNLYAEGLGVADIKAGQDNKVEIQMKLIEQSTVPGTVTVTFETNDGTTVPEQTIEHGGTVNKPADPGKEGFTFVGWYADSDLTYEYNFSSPVTGPITLYAKWDPVTDGNEGITINFLLNETDGLILDNKDKYQDIKIYTTSSDPLKNQFTAAVDGSFSSIQWYIWGYLDSSEREITIYAADYNAGTYQLVVSVIDKNGVPYSAGITFEVIVGD